MTIEEAAAKVAHVMRWAGRHAMFADAPDLVAEVDAVLAEERTAVLDLCLAAIRLAHSRCDDLSCEEAEEWGCARLTAALSPEGGKE